jgi:sugar/nucleoside kinase (ribokinase family)
VPGSERGGAGFDVVALGSAIVDRLGLVDPPTLAATGLVPGTMTLIDGEEAERLWSVAGGALVAGGSAANTCAGVAALGGSVAFVGRVGDDDLGRSFADDLALVGVSFQAPPAVAGAPTARCVIFVTPDGERTMRTFLGAAPLLDVDCVDESLVAGVGFVYLEGYLWDGPAAAPALRRAIDAGRSGGSRVALSLSDPGCVERHRDDFAALLRAGTVDLVFANESEVTELTGERSFEAAAAAMAELVPMAALTRGPAGSVVVRGGESWAVPAAPVDQVVDTTGAGDLYAAGFMVGAVRGLDPDGCARLGGLAAADVISALGARPHGDIRAAARQEGLLP